MAFLGVSGGHKSEIAAKMAKAREAAAFQHQLDEANDLANVSIQILTALFSYILFLTLPWRISNAVHLLGRSFAHALVKTVKLWERPTPYELIKQLEVVREKLPEIYDSGTTLNIWLERESSTPG